MFTCLSINAAYIELKGLLITDATIMEGRQLMQWELVHHIINMGGPHSQRTADRQLVENWLLVQLVDRQLPVMQWEPDRLPRCCNGNR